MNILAFESSCEETAAAVVQDGRRVLSDAILSQADMHAVYGGVVPEIASRKHVEAIAALADTAAGCCACSTGGDCVTSSCSIEYLRPARGDLFCEATPKKLGRKLSVIQVVIVNTEDKTVATGTFTFFMTRPGEAPDSQG